MTTITGGVTAPKGFRAAGLHCGVKDNFTTPQPEKKDLAMVLSSVPCAAAGTYTRNVVKADPVLLTMEHLADGKAQGVILDSGNANACAPKGMENAKRMADAAAKATGLQPKDFAVCSTGIIGVEINIEAIEKGIPPLAAALSDSAQSSEDAALAIMTTDTVMKKVAVEFEIDGKTCRMGGIAKGSGMIHPNMATMLVFLTTDAAISAAMLQKALSHDVQKTFNMLSVDGDTSTNDMVAILANGLAGNGEITEEGPAFDTFMKALNTITIALCRSIAGDGEGATKLLECDVTGAADEKTAAVVAKSVITSSLLKAAMFGADANWGRVLCAIGYSGADLDVNKVDVAFKSAKGILPVCKNGSGVDFSEEFAKEVLLEKEITILVELNSGSAGATAWGCDLTYDYVKINGDYRS